MGKRTLQKDAVYKVTEVKSEADGALLHRRVRVGESGPVQADKRGFVRCDLWFESGIQIQHHSGVRLSIVKRRGICSCEELPFPHRPGTTGCIHEEDEG